MDGAPAGEEPATTDDAPDEEAPDEKRAAPPERSRHEPVRRLHQAGPSPRPCWAC